MQRARSAESQLVSLRVELREASMRRDDIAEEAEALKQQLRICRDELVELQQGSAEARLALEAHASRLGGLSASHLGQQEAFKSQGLDLRALRERIGEA